MVSIFEQLGVRTIINAAGPVTRLSGARMDEDVIDAMREAAQVCVDIAELQAGAGQLIAEVTGAEAGYVTSGRRRVWCLRRRRVLRVWIRER